MTNTDRFIAGKDLRSDLAEYVAKLERLEIGEKIRHQEEQIAPRKPRGRQSLGRRLKNFLTTLKQLGRTRRRVEELQTEVDALRASVVQVVEREVAALGHGMADLVASFELTLARTRGDLENVIRTVEDSLENVIRTVEDSAIDGDRRIENAAQQANKSLASELRRIEQRLQFERLTRQKAFTDFDRRLILAQGPAEPATVPLPASPGVQSLLESFYYLLEERYRGTRAEIRQRLSVYRNDFIAARDRTGVTGPVIDVGCGRGELLELLRAEAFQALGIDNNDTQLDVARAHGVPVLNADAIGYLGGLPDDSVLAVTGIHIIEHFAFTDLVRLLQEVARVVRPGGIAIFETPNPRNLIVGATTFHLDPTHMRPLPTEVSQILLETVGFGAVEVRPLHPSDTFDYMVNERGFDRDIAALLFGPQDYAVIGSMR